MGATVTNVTSTYLLGSGKKVDESVSKIETKYVTVKFDSSYATSGGEAFDARTYSRNGTTEPFFVIANIGETATANAAYYVKYDKEAHKLLAYDADSEVGAVDLSGYTVTLKLEYKY